VIGGDGADDELSFRHLLIRDAAYGSLPKSERAALHDRFGTALEQQAGDAQQLTEIPGPPRRTGLHSVCRALSGRRCSRRSSAPRNGMGAGYGRQGPQAA